MVQIFVIVSILLALAFIGLGFNIFFRKQSFPETEIGKNKQMRSRGIGCVKCDEMRRFREMKKFTNITLDIKKLSL